MEIIDYPNYLIYDDGRVYNKIRNTFLKQQLNIKTGYYNVGLSKNDKRKNFTIHRLVGLHYLEKVEGKNVIDHIDRNKSNNHVSNLRWCNNSENQHNTNVRNNNKLGYKCITKTNFNTYIFKIQRQHNRHYKCFKTLEECIKYRDEYLEKL